MVRIIAQIIGFIALPAFPLSYVLKNRRSIIILNAASRTLYVIQYLLLGAFAGALLDVLGAISSVFAERKDTPFIKKHARLILIIMNTLIVCGGVTLCIINRSLIDLLPVAGVILHTSALWITNERLIRMVSFLGSPFWFVYNFSTTAYSSAIGDAFTMVCILFGMIKYRNKAPKKEENT